MTDEDYFVGDARRCPTHQQIETSSPDGQFDTPCPLCEMDMDESMQSEDEKQEHKHDFGISQ